MSKPQNNVTLVSIALTAATVCTARACTKRLDETQWLETRDETETRRQYVSRPRRLDRDNNPAVISYPQTDVHSMLFRVSPYVLFL